MKTIYKTLQLFLILLPTIIFSQATYPTSVKYTFTGGNNGGLGGNYATDVVVSFNDIDGTLEVAVKKITSQYSVLWDNPGGGCWTKRMVFNQTNRFVEFRMKSAAPVTGSLYLGWGGGSSCKAESKTWPIVPFTIHKANEWQIVHIAFGATTGSSQNIIDTIDRSIAWSLPDGNYVFDYITYGEAAAPVVPVIDQVKNKNVNTNAGLQTINLTGIDIPGRSLDGLTISAECKLSGIIKDLSIMDLGDGVFIDTNNNSASLQYSPVKGMENNSDTIIITLKDTIRNTVNKMKFKVSLLVCACDDPWDLSTEESLFSIYPTIVGSNLTIQNNALPSYNVEIVSTTGTLVFKLNEIKNYTTELDLSSLASGIYFVKLFDGNSMVTKKIVKQ